MNDNGVLIVIVSFNSCYLMQENIKSIRDTVRDEKYKIIVVDNASTDGVADWLDEQEDIILIKNTCNVGFAPACNQAVNATVGTPYEKNDVFLLNNDTRMTENALLFLKKKLYSADHIGAVGSISNYAGNRQRVDVVFDKVDDYIEYGRRNNVPVEENSEERVRLSGFAMLIRREAWDKVGGFDEAFAPGYFEDDALSMELLRNGYRLVMVKNSFIYHAGSQSFLKTDINTLLSKNWDLFKKKYGFDIMDYAYANEAVLSCISYKKNDSFRFLHAGCGLGAELKAVRRMFPNCTVVGIETNKALYDIVKNTEEVFDSYEGLEEAYEKGGFDVLLINDRLRDKMEPGEKELLVSMCRENAQLIVKNYKYENLEYEDIKLIIWDLDDTLWQGTLSETDVILPQINVELLKMLADHGIVNSISSKNNEVDVYDKLKEYGIDDLFVFNNINWEEKGSQINDKIKLMGLRAENTLFIDDNPRNLEEALFGNKSLMTAGPDIIPYLIDYYSKLRPGDIEHRRLEQYKLLEKKTNAISEGMSKEQFLHESNICITVNKNCLEELDRIHEMVLRTNQLNYTKNRDDKDLLTRQISNDWNECAYIKVRDRFGDYGIVGFYCYNTRERSMEHFLFSCRILGMGIEQYVYNKLGCPDFTVKEPVAVCLEKEKAVPWISESAGEEINEDRIKNNRVRILFKGPCIMSAIEPYLTGANITNEYNFVNNAGFVTAGQNHTVLLRESVELSEGEIEAITNEVPFIIKEDFETKLFSETYHVICFGLHQDIVSGLYRNKDTGAYISFGDFNYDMTDPANTAGYINGEIQGRDFDFTEEIIADFAKNWEFVGNTPIYTLLDNLDFIYENTPGKPLIILILGSEIPFEGNEESCRLNREINPVIKAFAEDHERIGIVSVSDFIHSQADYVNDINHFARHVYYDIAGEISRLINEYI